MICKYCGAAFRRENLKYCPYCDMEISEDEHPEKDEAVTAEKEESSLSQKPGLEWNLDKPTETRILAEPYSDAVCGTVKITVKGNSSLLSPATGTNYVMSFDEGAYQVRLTKGDQDISEFLKLPIGKHEGLLRYYSWNDQELKHPETAAKNTITIDVKDTMTAEIVIKTGTLFSSQKMEIIYK